MCRAIERWLTIRRPTGIFAANQNPALQNAAHECSLRDTIFRHDLCLSSKRRHLSIFQFGSDSSRFLGDCLLKYPLRSTLALPRSPAAKPDFLLQILLSFPRDLKTSLLAVFRWLCCETHLNGYSEDSEALKTLGV